MESSKSRRRFVKTISAFAGGLTFFNPLSSFAQFMTGAFWKHRVSANTGVGLISGGTYPSGSKKIQIYDLSSKAVSSGTSLTISRCSPGATGINNFGLIAGGVNGGGYETATSEKYTYSGNTIVAGANLIPGVYLLGAAGNANVGIFAGGCHASTGAILSSTTRYLYSADTTTSGGNLSKMRYQLAGIGNASLGIFAGGFNTMVDFLAVEQYNYSGNQVVPGANLSLHRSGAGAVGNSTVGIFAGGHQASYMSPVGFTKTSEKYTYSANTFVAGSNLSIARVYIASSGNSNFGLMAGGANSSWTPINLTEEYLFSSDAVTSGTNLGGVAQSTLTGTSSAPGGF